MEFPAGQIDLDAVDQPPDAEFDGLRVCAFEIWSHYFDELLQVFARQGFDFGLLGEGGDLGGDLQVFSLLRMRR